MILLFRRKSLVRLSFKRIIPSRFTGSPPGAAQTMVESAVEDVHPLAARIGTGSSDR